MDENLKPIPVTSPAQHPILYRLRCFIDLQLATIDKYLVPALRDLHGSVLDVGAGQSPWRALLPEDCRYQGLDVYNASEYGMSRDVPGVTYYDGTVMPLEDSAVDNVICIEVLEHTRDPMLLLQETCRVLRVGGFLLLTVPWSARRHHLPFDFHRFTRERLGIMLAEAGFSKIEILERGSDVCAIANKLIVLNLRLLKPRKAAKTLWAIPLGVLCTPLSGLFLLMAHISEIFGLGGKEDPLGYYVRAVK